jgi:UDP-N-acetylmuramate dehydrogenase
MLPRQFQDCCVRIDVSRPSLEKYLKDPKALYRNYPLAKLLYYRTGGRAEALLMCPSESDLISSLQWVCDEGVPYQVVGSGTNLLVSDRGLLGLTIFVGPSGPIRPQILSENAEFVRARFRAGDAKADVLDWAMSRRLVGLEFSAGIPGTMGGAIYMNAGTKWGSYAEVVEGVHLFSLRQGRFYKRADEMGFKYRGHGEGLLSDGAVVLAVDLKLPKAKDSVEFLESRNKVDEILVYRGTRQPLDYPSCGSVFKNPENSPKGAGRLIEAAGLKGLRRGRAMISLKHANFILNLGGASASDVNWLIEKVIAEVKTTSGIVLDPEVVRLGF